MKILISQNEPSVLSAYSTLIDHYGAELDFKPFYLIEPLSEKEFRAKHIDLRDYTAIVFSSRHTIDAYFKLCEALRVKVPDTMKYFCTTEVVAMYLQKYTVYRKRKVFFGNGTPESVVSLIGPKHKGEKFLIASTEGLPPRTMMSLFDGQKLDYTACALVKPVSQNLREVDFNRYDICVLYNPNDVKALYENWPDFCQGGLKFISFGKSIVSAMAEKGLHIELQGPTPEAPSAAKAIELYLSKNK